PAWELATAPSATRYRPTPTPLDALRRSRWPGVRIPSRKNPCHLAQTMQVTNSSSDMRSLERPPQVLSTHLPKLRQLGHRSPSHYTCFERQLLFMAILQQCHSP